MSTDWLNEQHLDALKALLPHITDRTVKRRVRECVLGLTTELTTRLTEEAVDTFAEEPIAPLTEKELTKLQALIAKGVQHNGIVPDLTSAEVGRSLQILSELLSRAHIGALDFEDQAGLEWIFDVAADAENGENRDNVRRVERLVRGGLGLTIRMSHVLPINEHLA